jgi:integrase
MPHQHHTVPSYREHKPSGQSVVTLDGRDHYLGKHGSPESRSKYERLIREYVNHGFRTPADSDRATIVAHVCERYDEFAARHYRHPDGSQTGTVDNTSLAMLALCEFAGDVPVEKFGPRLLDQFRTKLIERGLARHTINDRIGIVKRGFKWAARQELIPASVYAALATVEGLRSGRDGARETKPVKPVPPAHIEPAVPFMPEPVQAMVRLQVYTGARPGEIASMRACDIDCSGTTWIYRPALHKNSWRGQN